MGSGYIKHEEVTNLVLYTLQENSLKMILYNKECYILKKHW